MKSYFANTSYYVSLLVPQDSAHTIATTISNDLDGHSVTTAYIFMELAAYFAVPPLRNRFLIWADAMRRDPGVLILPAEQSLFDRGWEIFSRHADKSWSLTDCISFAVMNEHGITEALTTDHHFQQAGFTALLKS